MKHGSRQNGMRKSRLVKNQVYVFLVAWTVALSCPCLCTAASSGSNDLQETFAQMPQEYITTIMRLYAQVVSFPFPTKGWSVEPAHRQQRGSYFIIEYLPLGQTLTDWSEMYTVLAYQGLATSYPDVKPSLFFTVTQARKHWEISPKQFYNRDIYEGRINGYEAYIGLLGLKQLPYTINEFLPKGIGEIGLFLVIKGTEDFYVIIRAWRSTTAFTETILPVKQATLDEWIDNFKKVTLADPLAPP